MKPLLIAIVMLCAISVTAQAADRDARDPWGYVKVKSECVDGYKFALVKSATQLHSHQIFDEGKAVACETITMARLRAELEAEKKINAANNKVIEAWKERANLMNKQFRRKFAEQAKKSSGLIDAAKKSCKVE